MKKCMFCNKVVDSNNDNWKVVDEDNLEMISCPDCACEFDNNWKHLIGEKCLSPIYTSGVVCIGDEATVIGIPLTEANWYSDRSELSVELLLSDGQTIVVNGALKS